MSTALEKASSTWAWAGADTSGLIWSRCEWNTGRATISAETSRVPAPAMTTRLIAVNSRQARPRAGFGGPGSGLATVHRDEPGRHRWGRHPAGLSTDRGPAGVPFAPGPDQATGVRPGPGPRR